jgi:hypothetical protein
MGFRKHKERSCTLKRFNILDFQNPVKTSWDWVSKYQIPRDAFNIIMYETMLLKDLDIKTGFCQQAQEKAEVHTLC